MMLADNQESVTANWRFTMRLSPPTTVTWVVALALGVLGLLAQQGIFRIPGVDVNPFWMVSIGWVLLLVATLVKGL